MDIADLPEIARTWCWVAMEEISEWVTDGTHQPPPFSKGGIPFLVISNMVNGKIEWDKVVGVGYPRRPMKNILEYINP